MDFPPILTHSFKLKELILVARKVAPEFFENRELVQKRFRLCSS